MPSKPKQPQNADEENTIVVQNLKKYFPLKMGFIKTLLAKETPVVHAVEDVSFTIKQDEVFGLVGESGCGKTTTGRLLLRLIEPTEGKVIFKGTDVTALDERQMRQMRKKMQIIFQDPYESLNPRLSIFDIVSEPLRIQKICKTEAEVHAKVVQILEDLDLVPPEDYIYRFPHELSGGQRQRIAIARAFVLRPEFMVADEPLSMLDASIRSEVARLLLSIVKKYHCSFLYITHDIALARHMCDKVAVMYLGNVVERGSAETLITKPKHPYTEALIAAVPVPDPTARRTEVMIKGEVPSAVNPPSGCRFHTRCPYVMDICKKEPPKLLPTDEDRLVACYKYV